MEFLVFGDQAQESFSFLDNLLVRGNLSSLCITFLSKAGAALRHEVSQLALLEREKIPNFSTIQELNERYHDSGITSPAVESALLCVTQLAHYIE
jgi:hypothetical protein